jgi:xanthine dehydrogenase accessory factor
MRAELLQLAADLAQRRQPFVLAMVVRRQPYSSAQQGDMAIITADGGYHGWLGGNCTQPVVRREAARALADGRPRLLSLSPEAGSDDRPGVTVLPMVCQSGGTVDVYLEPVLPPPRLVLLGMSPVIRALAQLGKGLGYSVDVVAPEAEARLVPGADRVFVDWASPELRALGTLQKTHAVVATMGEHDDEAVTAALALRPAYLGVVASRTRFGQLRDALLARGVAAEPLARIRNPAGLDIGARLPEEVALSILAEIVQLARSHADEEHAPPPAPAPSAGEALDPVCGMTVAVATARHRAEHAGKTYYFCNPRCREKFLVAPEKYLTALPAQP